MVEESSHEWKERVAQEDIMEYFISLQDPGGLFLYEIHPLKQFHALNLLSYGGQCPVHFGNILIKNLC
jgi:hypothetical protein